jgi:hypothetical protein
MGRFPAVLEAVQMIHSDLLSESMFAVEIRIRQ